MQPSRPSRGDRGNLLPKASNPSRRAPRLKRHHPDICARIDAGEFQSIRAAAIAASIINVKTLLGQVGTSNGATAPRGGFQKQEISPEVAQ